MDDENLDNFSNTTTPVDTRARDFFTTITKRGVQTQASWEEAQAQMTLFLGLWGGLFAVTLVMGISRRIWSPESMNRKLSQQLTVLKSSKYWNVFMFLLMLALVVLYVLRSEKVQLDENLSFVELTAVAFFAIEAFITWLHFSSGGIDGIITFFFNYVFVACLVIPSVVYRSLASSPSHFSFGFCASIRAAQIWCEWVSFHRRGRLKFSDHILMYAATFLSGTFSMGMFIREMETLDGVDPNFLDGSEPPGENATAYERWSLFASLYMMFITSSKVGFGDLHPRNPVAQVVSLVGTGACVYLLVGVLMKVLQNNETGGLARPRYPNRNGFRHILIAGTPSLQAVLPEIPFRSFPIISDPLVGGGKSHLQSQLRIAVTNDVTNILIEVLIDIKIDLSWKFCAPNGMSAKLILEVLCEWVDAAFGACPCCALTHPGSLLVANWDL